MTRKLVIDVDKLENLIKCANWCTTNRNGRCIGCHVSAKCNQKYGGVKPNKILQIVSKYIRGDENE